MTNLYTSHTDTWILCLEWMSKGSLFHISFSGCFSSLIFFSKIKIELFSQVSCSVKWQIQPGDGSRANCEALYKPTQVLDVLTFFSTFAAFRSQLHLLPPSQLCQVLPPFQTGWKSQEPGSLDARVPGSIRWSAQSGFKGGAFYQFVTKQLDCMGAERGFVLAEECVMIKEVS